jgi:hypothetical protein
MLAVNKTINKYLENYAEQEIDLLTSFPKEVRCLRTVVIPAYKEKIDFIDRFCRSVLVQENVLMIVVINQPESKDDIDKQQGLFEAAKSKGNLYWLQGNLALLQLADCNSWLLLVDRFTQKIPDEQGVGLARKIGCDIALALFNAQQIKHDFIYSTDCDATLPDNYFSAEAIIHDKATKAKKSQTKTVALCFNFHHQSDCQQVCDANQQYEQALRYYVSGLSYANSPYAFFTIGSILAFRANSYAMVRGFPKRSAGEDFYLLNKLAKLGNIDFIEETYIHIEARSSDRVPFGTGPAVIKIMELNDNNQAYCYYHPETFQYLKVCLFAFSTLWEKRFEFTHWLSQQPVNNQKALLSIGFNHFVDKNNKSNEQQFNKQLQVWFDAFKTLKFIHALRDEGLANIPLVQGQTLLAQMRTKLVGY